MASIQSLGVGSGLLTSELVEDIIAAEREATDLRLEARRAEFDAKISAFGGVRSSLEALRDTAGTLANSSELLSNVVTSSNPGALAATATPEATPGIHAVEVLSLARAHTLSTGQYEDLDSKVGEGTLTFSFGTTTFDQFGAYDSFTANPQSVAQSVVIDETNNTLAGVRDAINNAGIGATASIVNDGSGYVLVLKSDATGVEQSMEIVVEESGDPGLSALAFNVDEATAGVNLTQTVAADDAVVNVDGIVVSRSDNAIDEVIPGVTINAIALNAGAPATLSIVQDVEQIQTRVQAFVDAFNDVKALADELTDFDTEAEEGALLTGDATLRGIRTQLRRFLSASIGDLTSPTIQSLVDLGLTSDQEAGYFLKFDAAKFTAALQDSPKDVRALLADESRASDPQIEFVNFANATDAGDYDVNIEQMATRGFYQGPSTAYLNGQVRIDEDNDTLALTVDGVATSVLKLTQAQYSDGAALAAEIENRINADPAIAEGGRAVSVTFDSDDNRLRIESDRYGSRSVIAITQVGSKSAAELGLDLDSGEANAGLDVAGTINGVQGIGSGQFLSLNIGPAAATSARLVGTEIAEFPLDIVDGDNNLTLTLDGFSSNAVSVLEGSYTSGGELAQALQTAINGDPVLTAEEATVTVSFDPTNQRLALTSDQQGLQSTLAIVGIDAGLSSTAGLLVDTGEPGKAEGRTDDPAGGAQIRVLGGEAGARGSVTLVRGVMNQLNRFLEDTLGFAGSLENKVDGLQERVDDIEEESADFDKRMDLLEARLRLQFAAADALISNLNSTSTFLEQQLENLPGVTRDK